MDAVAQAPPPDPGVSSEWHDAMRRGHAAREAGDAEAALIAYAEAAALAPGEPEPALHRGHALRLLGRTEDAAGAYGLARSLDPYASAPREALDALRSDGLVPAAPFPARDLPPDPEPETSVPEPARPPEPIPSLPLLRSRPMGAPVPAARSRRAVMRAGSGGTGLVLDVTDLLLHLGRSRIPTGIQRVVAGVTRAAVRRHGPRTRIVALDRGEAVWRSVPSAAFSDLLDRVGTADDETWDSAREAVEAASVEAVAPTFAATDALVSLGSPWGIAGHLRAVRLSGARWIPFLHDCAPLDRPEHCVRALVQDYARWFGGVAMTASGLICNSEATRASGAAHLDALAPGLRLPMEVARLDADPRSGVAPDRADARRRLGPRADEPYVLVVATIESRKDHLTVLRAWLSLLRRHGPERVPRLVLVGSKGWHAEAALGLLENSPELSEAVLLLQGLPDATVAALYESCLFTLYNSHLEGWGLPVTESLAWGKVPLVADLPALRESGGDAAVYVEPQNEAAMVGAVEALLDPAELAKRQAAVATSVPRRWDDVEAEIAGIAAEMAHAPMPSRYARGTLPLGQRLPLRRDDSGRPRLESAFAESLRNSGDWLPMTPGGAPFRGAATLRIPLGGAAPGGPHRLGLEVAIPPGCALACEVLADGGPVGRARIAPTAVGDGAAAWPFELPDGVEELVLRLLPAPDDSETVLRGLMLCREDDLLARLDFVEAQAHPSAPVP